MLLNFLSRKIISKNKELYNNYLDETCYLFGNGYSIKYIDFENFQNLNVFTSGYTYLHKDFEKLKIVGDFHLHPGIFSPVWKHPYTKKFTLINKTRKFFIKTNRISGKNRFFTSIYNYPFIKKKQTNYFLHNFNRTFDLEYIDPSYRFSLMLGSLHAMIGVGVYMGFKNFIFIGMDYLSSSPKFGHFYEFGIRNKIIENSHYKKRIKLLTDFYEKNNGCKFYFLSLKNSTSSIYENINYEQKFKTNENYKENFDIVKSETLKDLSNIEFEYYIYKKE